MMSRDDFNRIVWSLLLGLAMVAIGIAAVAAAHRATVDSRRLALQAQAKLDEARSKLVRARDEEAEIKSKIGRFNELRAAGIIGEEQRLEWVERIKAIKAARRLYDVQYEISPQHVIDAAVAPGASGSFDFFSSNMRLRMPLLHEEDLVRFLDDLQGSVRAYVRPESCSVERVGRSQAEETGAQLKAQCVLDWITVRERKAKT